MARYELALVLSPDLTEEEVQEALGRLRHLVGERGGSLEGEEVQGRRRLAYPIRKHGDGTFVLTQWEMPPQAVAAVGAGLRLDERVLRHLLVRLETTPAR